MAGVVSEVGSSSIPECASSEPIFHHDSGLLTEKIVKSATELSFEKCLDDDFQSQLYGSLVDYARTSVFDELDQPQVQQQNSPDEQLHGIEGSAGTDDRPTTNIESNSEQETLHDFSSFTTEGYILLHLFYYCKIE